MPGNNDTRQKVLSLCFEDQVEYRCSVPLKSFFEAYTNKKSLEDVMLDIADGYRTYRENRQKSEVSAEALSESMLDCVVPKIVNFRKNLNYFEDHPYKLWFDLAIILKLVHKDDGGCISMLDVTKDMLDTTGVSFDELLERAFENYEELFPTEFSELTESLPKEYQDIFTEYDYMNPNYILTNKYRVNGATTLFLENARRQAAE